MNEIGPQRGPASVPQIEAQAKQAARELAPNPPTPGELPTHWGHWIDRDGNHWWIFGKPGRFLAQCIDPETGMPDDETPNCRLSELTGLKGGWSQAIPLTDAGEVERLREELAAVKNAGGYLLEQLGRVEAERLAAQSAKEAAERERDEWKRQHDRVLSQAQKDFDRAAMADTYEQWLLDLGRISGCGHVDERLPTCIEEAFAKEHERSTAAEQRLAEVVGALDALRKRCERIEEIMQARDSITCRHDDDTGGGVLTIRFAHSGDALDLQDYLTAAIAKESARD